VPEVVIGFTDALSPLENQRISFSAAGVDTVRRFVLHAADQVSAYTTGISDVDPGIAKDDTLAPAFNETWSYPVEATTKTFSMTGDPDEATGSACGMDIDLTVRVVH
jgi:hypothetical protein